MRHTHSRFRSQANCATPWPTDQFSLADSKNIHEHVLRPDAGVFAEQFRGPPVQRFLLFDGAGVEHGDLDVDDILGPVDAIAGRAGAEVRRLMFGHRHELVVQRHV